MLSFIAMALVLKYVDAFNTFMKKSGHPITANWLFMSSPFYTIGICLSYVYIAKILGPKFMANRKPFQLRKMLIAYNLFQVIFSSWIFYEFSMSGWLTGRYSWRCQPVDYSNHPDAIRMMYVSWWFYISKYTDLMDTIFFLLRKKYNQITTLHVIHHGIMPMSVWFSVKFTPGGHSSFVGFTNSFVHTVMYGYYLLACLGPHMQKYLWWKKHLTTFQMIQFVMMMIHAFQLLFIDCDYPRVFVWFVGLQAVMFFFLFKDFYNQSYDRRTKKKAQIQKNYHSENRNGYTKEYSNAECSKLHQRTKLQRHLACQ